MSIDNLLWKTYWLLKIIGEWWYSKPTKSRRRGYRMVECLCECWNNINISFSAINAWRCNSCWCYQRESVTTHWDTKNRLYRIYWGMLSRCNNVNVLNYKLYWWRWIRCLRQTYSSFKSDMFESYIKHLKIHGPMDTSLDRIDNNWNYCQENCRWSTHKQQANNRSNSIKLEHQWQSHTIQSWSKIVNINESTIRNRLYRWWSIEKALSNVSK